MTTKTNDKPSSKNEKRKNAWKNLPDVWALIKPRRGLLALGFALMAVNRVAGLVLPASTKNLIDTGLVEFVGGLMTAAIALVYLIHTSVLMTAVAFGVLLVFGFGISKAFATIRPIFRARPKITGEVTGRLTESLSGVRVVKG